MARAGFGDLYADDAREFANSFPAGQPITAKDLDLWGMKHGFITNLHDYDDTPCDSAAWQKLVNQRNKMRKRLNAGATSAAFMEGNGVANGSCQPFSIDVDVIGETYLVRDAEASFKDKTRVLPKVVNGFTRSKVRRLERIKQAVSVASLPPGAQLQIVQVGRQLEKFQRDVQRQSVDLEDELANLEEWIRRNYGQSRLSAPEDSVDGTEDA